MPALRSTTPLHASRLPVLGIDLRGHLHVARRDQAFAATSLDCNATAASRAAHDAHRFVLLVIHLHLHHFVSELNQDLFELVILVPLLLVLLLKQLLTLRTLLEFALSYLQVDLQD